MKHTKQPFNLNTALARLWVETERVTTYGPDFVAIGGLVILGMILTVCLMVW